MADRKTRRITKRVVDALKPGHVVWDSEVTGLWRPLQGMSQSVLKLARAALLDGRLCCVLQLVKFGFFAVIDES